MEPLNRAYLYLLACLSDIGGSADLDKHGRLVTGPQRHPLQGDSVAYLVLVSRGLVAGEGGKIILTAAGREALAGHDSSLVREAS